MTTLEARIHGLSFADIIDGDSIVDPSGGDLKLDSYSIDGADYAEIEHLGRKEKTYGFDVFTLTKSDIMRFIEELETAPEDCEFCPYEEDLVTYAKLAHGSVERPLPYLNGTELIWKGHGEVICRDSHFYDADEQGLGYRADQALPVTWTGTNEGTRPGKVDYLMLSGDYAYGYQTREVDLVFNLNPTRLIDSMLRGDRFVLDRYGNVRHLFKTEMESIYSKLQASLGGSTYFDYAGGSCAYQDLWIDEDGKMLIPFYGPLPVTSDGCPQLTFYVTNKAGAPKVSYATTPGLGDLTDTEHIITMGWNTVDIPDVQGEEFIAFGLTTDDGQITISSIEATVDRYLAEVPTVDPGDTLTVTIQDGYYSSHSLSALHMVYRNGYYF